MSDSDNKVYLSLTQGERASQRKVKNLLPQDLYEQLAEKIKNAVPANDIDHDDADDGSSDEEHDFQKSRSHNAILIEGGRGTGKSTVLVNLPLYLSQEKYKKLAKDVHVLKPVDPTQLEDGDDIFLNVIVAAVLRDSDLKKAQQRHEAKRQELYRCLQELGQALEGQQTQKKDMGMDKLRAFMGSHAIALAVHRFFKAALSLLNKKLLVLPIDDVDTTLHRAFENLEVVRRYLATPVVLPLICGELSLYDEVIWRDFYCRMTKDGKLVEVGAAQAKSKSLALEYERKLLPLQNRMQMPSVDDYLVDRRILLQHSAADESEKAVGLVEFHRWVTALIIGTVNGLEKSNLRVPIPTVRALSQLLNRVKDLIGDLSFLPDPWKDSTDGLYIRRLLWMPELNAAAMQAFVKARKELSAEKKLDSARAYAAFAQEIEKGWTRLSPVSNHLVERWHGPLADHFRYEPQGGAAYLILLAHSDWKKDPNLSDGDQVYASRSVLATPLFQPILQQDRPDLLHFDRSADISLWKGELAGRLPASMLERLPVKAILPFATPEIGRAVPGGSYWLQSDDEKEQNLCDRYNLIVDMVLNRNYYSENYQASLACVGRIVEVLVTSLVRRVSVEDLEHILAQPPFHSAAAVAPTKTLFMGVTQDGGSVENSSAEDWAQDRHQFALQDLVREIGNWREQHRLDRIAVSPWLIYNVLNKLMNQAPLFNPPLALNQQPKKADGGEIIRCARLAFNAFWAAVGSFEKGPLFGLPDVVATVNIGSGESFENSLLYRQNISPFASNESEKSGYGKFTRSITYVLRDHPLREWFVACQTMVVKNKEITIDDLVNQQKKLVGFLSTKRKQYEEESARIRLFDLLKAENPTTKTLTVDSVVQALDKNEVTDSRVQEIWSILEKEFPNAQVARRVLSRANNERADKKKENNDAEPPTA